jgi:D-alanyl-D-alanine dipeptidase
MGGSRLGRLLGGNGGWGCRKVSLAGWIRLSARHRCNHHPGYSLRRSNKFYGILLREVAEALKLVQADLRPRDLSLKVYDCYRPVRAVKAFIHWAQKARAGEEQHWPRTQRGDLVKLHYVASSSVHSTGAAVDLTLVRLPLAGAAPTDPNAIYAPCNAARAAREPDNSVERQLAWPVVLPHSGMFPNRLVVASFNV